MAVAGSIIVAGLLSLGAVAVAFLFAGPFIQGRYSKAPERRKEHRHNPHVGELGPR